ncbi:DUF3408 domain-containing protein [Chryseobacterium herbae]|uniref:DUF3408 domain-containing protein n=1 Tax=Chryseobacterium herbae TaxID=2976476 RepID=A0ABT2ISI4_9FLAO|nr:DUF3408 domain-containing protein [Chryseobacterium sp. pc1-10]MCT2561788.1 DUF3408 domain-containing protein [Chryseobacterium sp. pc1-10]
MEDRDKKKDIPELNEEFIMNEMQRGVRKEGMLPVEPEPHQEKESKPAAPIAKEKSRTKKINELPYEDIFFRSPDTSARHGKSVYISPEFHERLSRIVQVIGEDKLTIYAYLNNVLAYHFQEFGEDITKSFNDKYKPIL